MITIFIIFFVLLLIDLIILGIMFSKITFKVIELDIYNRGNKTYIDNIVLEINIYLFGLIKFVKIEVYKNYFKIFGIKIKFKSISKFKLYQKMYNEIDLKKYLNYYIRKINYKNISLRIKYIDLKVNLGTSNPILTSIAITSISSFLPFIVKKYMKINDINFKYTIIPNYFNINNYQLSLKTCFNINVKLLIKEVIKIMNNNTVNVDNSINYNMFKEL